MNIQSPAVADILFGEAGLIPLTHVIDYTAFALRHDYLPEEIAAEILDNIGMLMHQRLNELQQELAGEGGDI